MTDKHLTDNIIPTDEPGSEQAGFPKRVRNYTILAILVLMGLNLALYLFFPVIANGSVHLDGTPATDEDVRNASIRTVFFGIPMLGFLLGTLTALLPYKGLTWTGKYFRASLLTILVLELIVASRRGALLLQS